MREKMYDKNYLRFMMATALMLTSTEAKEGRYFDPDEISPPKKVIPNGCKEYTFYGHKVIALNENSAIKKCKKLAGIK